MNLKFTEERRFVCLLFFFGLRSGYFHFSTYNPKIIVMYSLHRHFVNSARLRNSNHCNYMQVKWVQSQARLPREFMHYNHSLFTEKDKCLKPTNHQAAFIFIIIIIDEYGGLLVFCSLSFYGLLLQEYRFDSCIFVLNNKIQSP